MELAVRSTVGAQRAAKIVFEAVIAQRVSAVVGNVLALLQVGSVTLMSVATVGLGKYHGYALSCNHSAKVF
jgi:hypothetical protein